MVDNSFSVIKKFAVVPHVIGFYPIVDHVNWLKILAKLEVKTIQLRLKNLTQIDLERQIEEASRISQNYNLSLFINDHWELAVKYQCFGVHLGQEDLDIANINIINEAGLRLGISTHNYVELARSLTLNPSYIALGPIYPTTTKKMKFSEQGLIKLKIWRKLCQNTQLVAIGGIFASQMSDIWKCKVDGVAVVSYVTKSNNVELSVRKAQSLAKFALKK